LLLVFSGMPEIKTYPELELATTTSGTRRQNFDLLETGPANGWNLTTVTGLILLVALWAYQLYSTWAAWGNLTIDSGHEMYIPALLAEGKKLYRDVWFMYGPAAPYFNAYLFRLFGIHLNVLYWAGSLSALGSAIFLYLIGMQLSAWPIGWTAGAVLLLEAFEPSLFCFPLPYTFSAVYACFAACLFLWLVIRGTVTRSGAWMFAAGSTAALALLLKPEFGMACYLTIILWIAMRSLRERSVFYTVKDILAILPGIVICVFVVRWMISIRGVEFITQENIVSWPTSYFMKHYGKLRLGDTGFALTAVAFRDAGIRALFPAGALLEFYFLLNWKRTDLRSVLLSSALASALIIYCLGLGLNLQESLRALIFPLDMVSYVCIGAIVAWILFIRRSAKGRGALVILLSFSSLLAFRILWKMTPSGYPIYYNGPVVLCFLLLLMAWIRRTVRPKFNAIALAIICVGCFFSVALYVRDISSVAKNYVPLVTERGMVRVQKQTAQNYRMAINFMKEKAALGEYVLSVPEDTSLYFLSETYCPTRLFSFIPGVLAPGRMTDELIAEIESKPVRYLLWSNRTFFEYGVPVFGKDFEQPFGDFLKTHYHRLGLLAPNDLYYGDWNATVWERNETN
jgi:hypothetical protein